MISLAFALAAASVADQMAPARKGMLQCQMPDALFKTCASLSKVVEAGPSTYRIETRMLVDPTGPVVATIHSTVTVQGPEICERMELKDLADATFASAGKPIPAATAARYISVMRRAFAAVEGKQVCTQIAADDQGTTKVLARIGGKRVPALDYDMIWVDPADGWVVAR
jgi:hypothetical protein